MTIKMPRKASAIFKLEPNYDNRVFGLDLMRAFAIIFVVMGHGIMLEKVDTNFPWIRLINGVELFFVLSGFLIGSILLKIFLNNSSYSIQSIGKFWIRRWFRTLPNYYLVLCLNVIIVYFGIIKEDFTQFNWKFCFFLQNFAKPFTGFFWESWSLSIEEWFYFLFPIILILIYLPANRFRVDRKNIFLISIIVFLITPLLLRFFIASKFEVNKFWLDNKINKVVIYRLDGIAFGLLAAYIKYWYPEFWRKSRYSSFILGLIISYLVLYKTWLPDKFSTKVFYIFFQSIGCFLLLPFFDNIKKAPPTIVRIITHISLISYSMYLLNLAIVAEIMRDHFPPHSIGEAWTQYVIYWIVVILLSTLLYKYFEKPVMDIREKWQKH
jgi:peptidoglycan/LPS O-acetylase OafA/YrhL